MPRTRRLGLAVAAVTLVAALSGCSVVAAFTPHVEPAIRAQRHATAAQAGDLQRMPGYDVRWIEVGCCSDAAVARAVDLAVGGDAGPPYAVFVSGSDRRAAAAVVDRVIASGLDRVWRVSP